jgi:hypothetical protein
MPGWNHRVATIALALGLLCAQVMAEQPCAMARLHPWGLFNPGAWQTVRVVAETIDEQGQVVSTCTSNVKTVLLDADNNGVALEIQTCMEVAGKHFEAEPQVVRQDFLGELANLNCKPSEPVDSQVVVDNRKIACKLKRLECHAAKQKTRTSIYYSATVAPYVLKRVTVTSDAEGKTAPSETDADVVALDMPVKVRGETKRGAYVKTVCNSAKGAITTLAVVVPEIPGGVVSHSSKEVDAAGRLVRRSTLELVDYGVDPDKDRSGLFNRNKRHRAKSTSRYGATKQPQPPTEPSQPKHPPADQHG